MRNRTACIVTLPLSYLPRLTKWESNPRLTTGGALKTFVAVYQWSRSWYYGAFWNSHQGTNYLRSVLPAHSGKIFCCTQKMQQYFKELCDLGEIRTRNPFRAAWL